jgi:hypothetical protein
MYTAVKIDTCVHSQCLDGFESGDTVFEGGRGVEPAEIFRAIHFDSCEALSFTGKAVIKYELVT